MRHRGIEAWAEACNNRFAMRVERISTSVEYTAALARGLADILEFGDVVALRGEMGAGKTTFVRALARALGAGEGLASSPTFVMVNQYPFEQPRLGRGQLVHVDAYRLTSGEDVETLGWDALFDPASKGARGRAVAVIEWADRIAGVMPDERIVITITPTGEETRAFVFEFPESWRGRAMLGRFAANEPTRCRISAEWVSPTGEHYPFASERAKLADLHRWFSGTYTASREIRPEDADEG